MTVILGLYFLLILLNVWLSSGEGEIRLKLDVQDQGGEIILDVDGQGGMGGGWGRIALKTGQFSWTSYVYHP